MQSVSVAAAIARAVRIAASYGPYRATCLPRALVLWTLLRWRRLDGELTIGVRNGQGGFEAHAWVTLNGVPLDQNPEPGWFVPLQSASSPDV
jgi:Transglutaminase-like superfamily